VSNRKLLPVALALTWLASAALAAPADPADTLAIGARIYNEGKLSAGAPLRGVREGRATVVGADAACANCHRPSGLGQVEGDLQVPPIGGNFLFGKRGEQGITTMDPHVSKLFNQAHDPYTEETLMRAVRDGINSQGRRMSVLMPRYALDQAELAGLAAYLRQLSTAWSPGVTPTTIKLATVVTPDVDAARRKVFIDMMRAIARQKNASTVVADPKKNRHHMVTAAEMINGTERNWDLQIWELQGPPETWREQLETRYRSQPAFALVSGLSDSSWRPVQEFCNAERVPCWFPSAQADDGEPGAYTLYFSGGVKLEAALLARSLSTAGKRPKRVIQVYRGDATGLIAARSLNRALAGSGIEVADRKIEPSAAADSLRLSVGGLGPDDALMLWLRPDDVMALGAVAPPEGESYFSGSLAKGERAPLTAAWRARAHLVYPYELPARRSKNLEYFNAWRNLSRIPLVDEPMQSEVFFAMNFLTDTLAEMLDNLYRDYLIERAEQMLSRREGIKAEQETRDRIAMGKEGDLLRRRGPMTMDEATRIRLTSGTSASAKSEGTTIYAHLSLGPGQRLASKSGYIVRFTGESGGELTAESDLITP
jgi:mono/diheme cytochrome c family protein